MKSKVCVVTIVVAAFVVAAFMTSRAPSAAKPITLAASKQAPVKDVERSPQLTSYRVFEDEATSGALPYRGASYAAKVDAQGLTFEAGGHRMSLGATRIEQGGASAALSGSTPSRESWAKAVVAKADGVTEEFIFENRRVEHLVRVQRPLGEGSLTARIAVKTTLTGPVETVRRGDESWKDLALEDGGLRFTTSDGSPGLIYHGAVAVDAAGRKQLLDARWENGEIALEVPALFMKDAAYPVLIDPWLELDFSGSSGGVSLTGTVSESPAITLFNGSPAVAWSDASADNFEIYFRYWNGTRWTALGTSDTGTGVSATPGTSTNPAIGNFNPTNTTLTHPFIAWEDDSSGTTNIYAKFWTGTTWSALAGSATSTGISKTLGTAARNPQAAGLLGLVQNDPLGSDPSRVELLPCVVYEIPGTGLFCQFFYPGDNRDQAPPAGWYDHPSGGVITFDASAAHPSTTTIFNQRLAVAFEATNGGTQFDVFVLEGDTSGLLSVTTGIPVPTSVPGPAVPWAPIGNGTGNVCAGLPSALSIQPALAVDGNGDYWVAWQESVGAEREIYVRTSPGGGAWTGVGGSSTGAGISGTNLPAGLTTSSFPAIAVNTQVFPVRPAVAWEDDFSGNTEVYLRRLNAAGTAWDQVADEGSASLVAPEVTGNNGGISRTPSFSLRPKVAQSADGGISVAWRDGAAGTFDLFVRRYYDNSPTNLTQQAVNGLVLSPLSIGGTSGTTTVQFSSVLVAESSTLPINLRLQLEIRPNTAVFTEQITHESAEVASGGTATVLFTGLPNVNYHWRARSIDSAGRSSPWVPFGNNLDGVIDFRINSGAAGAGGTNNATGGTDKKDKCGLTGLEVFAALALVGALRRRKA